MDSQLLRRRRRPTPPGEILEEHYLITRGITQNAFAANVEISGKHLSRVVGGMSASSPTSPRK